MRRLTTALLAAACLVPLSCGGGDGDGEDDGAAADQADARQAIVAFEDAVTAEGFAPSEDDEDDDDDDGFEFTSDECRELDALLSNDDDLEGETADEESEELVRTEDTGAEEMVQASLNIADADALQARLDAFTDDRTASCLEEGVANSFAAQETEVALELLDVVVDVQELDGIGDAAVLVEISAVIAGEGFELPLAIEVFAVRSGRRGAIVNTSGIGIRSSVDVEELAQILLTGAPA